MTEQRCEDLDPGVPPCSHYIEGGFCTLGYRFRCVEWMKRNAPTLSYTTIADYTSCHRKFWWNQVKGLERIEKSWPLQLGSHASLILGRLHHRDHEKDCVDWYKDYITTAINQSVDPDIEDRQEGHEDLWAMMAIFDAYIAMDFHTLKGITEYEFHWNDPEYPRVHGFIDLLDLNTYDAAMGYEFKYSSKPDNYEQYIIEDQLCAYFISDLKIKSMTTRVFVPPMQRPKDNKKEGKESMVDFYDRVRKDVMRRATTQYFISKTYWRQEFDLENYKNKARRVSEEIIRYTEEGGIEPFYQNKRACLAPFKCDYYDICKYKVISDTLYRKKTPRVKQGVTP